MTYRINGAEVTREEFLKNSSGIVPGSTFNIHSMQPFVSPIDGKEIGSQDELSAHNRAHDVYQVGNEFTKNKEAENKLKREEYLDTQRSH